MEGIKAGAKAISLAGEVELPRSIGSFVHISPPTFKFCPLLQTKHQPIWHSLCVSGLNLSYASLASKPTLWRATDSNTDAPISILEEGPTSFVSIEEKVDESSTVSISTGYNDFVDYLVDSAPCKSLFVVHDSLLILACVKEKYDKVKCWQGEILHIPKKWAPFDVVFLYFLPALLFKLDDILGSLAKKCSLGEIDILGFVEARDCNWIEIQWVSGKCWCMP